MLTGLNVLWSLSNTFVVVGVPGSRFSLAFRFRVLGAADIFLVPCSTFATRRAEINTSDFLTKLISSYPVTFFFSLTICPSINYGFCLEKKTALIH